MKQSLLRKISMVLVLSIFFALPVSPAAADTAVYSTTQRFMDYLDQEEIKYSYLGIQNGLEERVNVSYRLENFDSIQVSVFFDEDGESASLRAWDILTATEGKSYILSVLNDLNKSYKYMKFVLDESDNTVQVEMDMYIDEDSCGRCVYDAMIVIFIGLDIDSVAEKLHSLE